MPAIIKYQHLHALSSIGPEPATDDGPLTIFRVPVALPGRLRSRPPTARPDDPTALADDEAQADDALHPATLEAEAIRAAANAEAALLREQAWHEGYQAGLDEGRTAASQVVDTSVERLRSLASAATADRTALLRDAETQVVELALAVARTVIHREVALDPVAITATVDALLTHLQGEVVTSLRAHPDDAPMVAAYWAERARSAADRGVQVIADHRIGRGGCRIDTQTGAWDGTVETQLERIQQAMSMLRVGGAPR